MQRLTRKPFLPDKARYSASPDSLNSAASSGGRALVKATTPAVCRSAEALRLRHPPAPRSKTAQHSGWPKTPHTRAILPLRGTGHKGFSLCLFVLVDRFYFPEGLVHGRSRIPAPRIRIPATRFSAEARSEPRTCPHTVCERLLNVLWTCWAGSTSVVISRPANGQRPGQRGNFLAGPAAYMRPPLNATGSWVCEFGIVTHWLNELHPGSPWMLNAYLSTGHVESLHVRPFGCIEHRLLICSHVNPVCTVMFHGGRKTPDESAVGSVPEQKMLSVGVAHVQITR